MAIRDDVQAGFGELLTIESTESIYAYGDVWRATVHGGQSDVAAVVKRTWRGNPHALESWQRALVASGVRTVAPLLPTVRIDQGDEASNWVAYPWFDGREWDGSVDDLRAAGRLLGAMHAASEGLTIDDFPEFEWGSDEQSSIAEDIEGIQTSAATHWPQSDTSRWIRQLSDFGDLLARMRGADLPMLPASLDHRAANLLFQHGEALIFDLENAAHAPRVFDLAVAVLLFPLEHPHSRGRALDVEEWAAFFSGYREAAPPLTGDEREAWPDALTYMKLEWGTWHLTEGIEADVPGNLDYLEDLLTLDEHTRFALG